MIKNTYEIEIKKNVLCKAGTPVMKMIDDLNGSGHAMMKSIIGPEKRKGSWCVFLDEISENDSNMYGVIVSIKDKSGEEIDLKSDTELANLILSDPYEIQLSSRTGNLMTGILNTLKPDTAAAVKNVSALGAEIEALIQEKIDAGIVTKEIMDKRMEIFKANYIDKDEFLLKRVISGYRKYKKPAHIPSCIYVDPYLEASRKRGEEGIIAEGLRAAVSRQAVICEGEKSVGKNVYMETIAFLMGMPQRLITFSRAMSPSSIYGEKTTDNSAAEALASKEAYEGALAKARIEAGNASLADYEKAARFEVMKAQSASVNIVIDQSELYDWLDDGGIIVFNEMNMAEANFFASFTNQLLDGTGYLFIPGRGEVKINRDCVLFGTQNADYEGVEQQNEATMSRFGCISFKQPESIIKQIEVSTMAALKRDGFEGVKLDKKYYSQCQDFYKKCRGAVRKGTVTNAVLNIRGFVRALTATAESNGFAKLKRQIEIHVIGTCPFDEREALLAELNQIVTL